jgi:hypothetical protein
LKENSKKGVEQMEHLTDQPQEREAVMKFVTVKFSSGEREPQLLMILPGTTTSEVLNKLGLGTDFLLSKGTADTVFGHQEPIYPLIEDGDLLFASSRIDAGS